jgi:hypothetical protein
MEEKVRKLTHIGSVFPIWAELRLKRDQQVDPATPASSPIHLVSGPASEKMIAPG